MTDDTSELDSEGNALSCDQRTEPLPDTLQFPCAKLEYLYLRTVKKAQVADIQRALGRRALAQYPILEMLVDHKLVERADDGYVMATEHNK